MRAIRSVVLSLLIVVLALIALSYLSGSAWMRFPRDGGAPVGTSGSVETARARGAEVGERVATAAAKVKETAGEAALTSKIKAKMILDDHIEARAIDVSTAGSTVTMNGTVRSADEHDRAVRMVRETAGVTRVIDQLRIDVR